MYSGNLVRQAHYERYTSVAGVSPAHAQQTPGRGMFEPTPEAAVPAQPGDVWQPYDQTPHTGVRPPTPRHTATPGRGPAAPIPSGVDEERGQNTVNDRMVATHANVEYVPYERPVYKHGGQGRSITSVEGRRPLQPSMEAFLVGNNSYDTSNPPSEVYGGERYRLGTADQYFGRYEYWTKQGQDGWLRPTVTEHPILPVEKPRVANSAPYTRNSSGRARSLYPMTQDPRMFVTPSETALSDYTMANQQLGNPGGFVDDGGRL